MDPTLAGQPPKKKKRVSFDPGIQTRAEASGSVTQEQSKFAYSVSVTIPSTGEVIVENMDGWALRRFTMVGHEQLPHQPTITDRMLNHTIELREEGSCAPSKAATFAVLQWMQDRQDFVMPGCIKGHDLGRDDLDFLLNAYAACSALRTTFQLFDLENFIKKTIDEKGVNLQELAAMVELLPHDHPITHHAVKWLVNLHLSADIDPEFEDPSTKWISNLPELKDLFEGECRKARAHFPRSD